MKTKKCESCNACKPLYQKFRYSLGKIKLYYCTASESMTQKENACEKWQPKRREYDLSKQRFDEAENDLKYLLSIIKDE